MLNLIRTEIYKLKRQKLMGVLSIAVFALSAFSAYCEITLLAGTPVGGKARFAAAFQDVFMLFAVAVFAGFYIGSDFSNRTIQAALARGQRRVDILLSKAVVFSLAAVLLLLVYPVTACAIHTLNYGWGEPFGVPSALYLLRVALLGSVLNAGTASIYVCLAFMCRDIPKTICACFAFPVVFSAISATLGKQAPALAKLLEYSTLSQLKHIAGGSGGAATALPIALSACITIAAALTLGGAVFSRAEIR